jgi:hypothetical protein
MKIYFDHEKLDVYQEAIAFCGWPIRNSCLMLLLLLMIRHENLL